MSGQDRPGIPGLSWSAFGGQRSPSAWGGAAAELQTPPSTIREVMRADEAQAKAERAFAARRVMAEDMRSGAVSHTMTAEAWMQEALRTKPDARTGQLHCPTCSRPAADYHTLAQHMKYKHGHEPPARGPVTVSLSDLLEATSRFPHTTRSAAPVPRLSSKQMQGVRGLLKAFPTQHALADALRKQKPFLTNKKRLSRLKRIILKERGEKALGDATDAAAKASKTVEAAHAQRDSIQGQLKAAIEKVTLDNTGQSLLDAAAITHLQVVEAAANDAEQAVLEAERNLQTAHAKLSKLQQEREAQESARASDLQKPLTSPGDAPAFAEAAEGSSSLAPFATATVAKEPSRTDEGRAAYVSKRPFVSLSDMQKYAGVAEVQREWMSSPAEEEDHVAEETGDASEADEGYESSVEGLDDFEDILASWMHSSRGLLAEKDTVTGAAWVRSKGTDKFASFAAVAPQQQEEPKAPGAGAAPSAAAAAAEQKAELAQRERGSAGKSEVTESDSEDEEDMGPGDWDDILAVWMTAAGLPNLEEEGQADSASDTSESLSDDETLSGNMTEQSRPVGASFRGTGAAPLAADFQGAAQPLQSAAQPWSQLPAPQTLPASQAGADQVVTMPIVLPVTSHPPQKASGVSVALTAQGVLPTATNTPESAQAPMPSQESLAQQMPELPQAPSQAPSVNGVARQVPQLPVALDSAAISQFLASYKTGQTNTAGRPVLAMGPLVNPQASDSLPLLGAGLPGGSRSASTSRGGSHDGGIVTQQASPSVASPLAASSASYPAMSQMASAAGSLQGSSSGAQPPSSLASVTAAMSQMAATTRTLQSHWQAMLSQQGQPVPVEELLDRRLFGNASNETSLMASPVGSVLLTPQLSMGIDRATARLSSAGSRGEAMPEQPRQQPAGQPRDAPRSTQAAPPSVSIDEARQRALDAILKKHEMPVNMHAGSAGPQLPQVPSGSGDGSLPSLSEQELLMLQQTPQTSQTHDAFSFWLNWQAQQERQQASAQALQQGLQSMSLHQHQHTPHSMQGVDPFAMRAYGSTHAMDANQGLQPSLEAGWPAMAADSGALGSHDFTCEVCGITCCGLVNFEQHCSSKKHLRKAAAAAGALTGASVVASDSTDTERNTTYVGLQAQCRSYCKQVISTELNRAVLELLQQLLFWQERAKSASPYNLAKRKRLVSGLREVAKAVRLRKACTVVVAPNIEHIEAEGGLDDLLTSILTQAEANSIPIVFALSRKKLGQMFGCRKKMSAIAILDYGGAEAVYHHMEALAEEGRQTWIAHHGSGSGSGNGSVGSRPPSQPQASAQAPQQQQPASEQKLGLGAEAAKPALRPLSAGRASLDLAQAQARRPPMQGMPPQQQQQQPRGIPPHYGSMPKPSFPPEHQRPYGGQPQHRAGQHGQHLPPRYHMPQDPRFHSPGGQYRLTQPSPQMHQQQQQQAMAPNEAMGLHKGLQPQQQERWNAYEHHMALLHLQHQQGGGYDASDAAQLAELQGVPLTSLGSLSNDALMSLQALRGQPFEQGQLAALYTQQQQQQLNQQLQLSSLSNSEHQGFGLQDPGMQPAWHSPDLGSGPWMP